MNLLLVDIGNTHLSWAIEQDGEFRYGGQTDSEKDGIDNLFESHFCDISPERVVIANVAGSGLIQQMETLVAKKWGIQVEKMVSKKKMCGVTNAYAEPAQLGIDRLAAMVSAYEMIKAPICVADCGTAITIDIVDAKGEHQGGYILPGFRLMQESLLQKSVNILEGFSSGKLSASVQFGKTTGECLRQGSLLAAQAAIEQAHALAVKKLESPVQLLLTGGDGQMIQTFLSIQARFEAHLVLKGLGLMARCTDLEMNI